VQVRPFAQPRIYNACVSDLKGKTVFITGGARRLGRAIALAMARTGANVAFTFRSSANEAGETLKEIKAAGVQAQGCGQECHKAVRTNRLADQQCRSF
jgi:NAD(P)-dependent dehydrogenase (short-subunit alcohol dehydrogenase family)